MRQLAIVHDVGRDDKKAKVMPCCGPSRLSQLLGTGVYEVRQRICITEKTGTQVRT